MRAFENYSYEEVEQTFGLVESNPSAIFLDWLAAANEVAFQPNANEKAMLMHYRDLLFKEVKNWNEDELKLFFIGPMLMLVDFNTPYFKPFAHRTLSLKQGDISASGKVDFLIAKGKLTPQIPFFCLHEYKQENRRENDPLGQLLISMVAARLKNETNLPVYGTYVSGRSWFFAFLEGNNYYLSNAFNAADDDILAIYAILKKGKKLIEKAAQGT